MGRAEEGRRGGAGSGGRGGWGGRCDAPPEGGADRVGREAGHGHVEPLRGPAEPELLEVVVARGDQLEHRHVLQLHQVQRRQTELEELVHHDDPQRRGGAGACEVEGGGVRGHWPAHRRARLVLPLGRVPQQVRQHQRAVEHRSPCCGVAQRDELVRVAKLRRVEQVALVIGAGSGGMRRTCTRQSVGKAGRDRAQVHHPPATGEWAARQENEGQEQEEHEEPPRVLRRRRPALWLGRPREGLIDGSSSCGHPHHAGEVAVRLERRRRQQSANIIQQRKSDTATYAQTNRDAHAAFAESAPSLLTSHRAESQPTQDRRPLVSPRLQHAMRTATRASAQARHSDRCRANRQR